MRSSKLIETLKVLTSKELHELGLFLHSPYFQTKGISEDEVRLFNYLKKQYPDYKEERIDRKKVFKVVYPDSVLVKGKLEKKMSALLRHIQRFIILEHWEAKEEPLRKQLLLSRFYQERGASSLHKMIIRRIQKALNGRKQKDKIYYFNEFLLQSEISEHQSLHTTRKDDLNFSNTLRSLDIFYIAKKLEYSCGLLSLKKPKKLPEAKNESAWGFNLETFLSTNKYLEIPLVKVYYKAFSFLENRKDISSYHELLRLLKKHKKELAKEDLKILRTICRNFSIYQFNQGKKEYLEGTVRLYQEDLADGLLYHKNGLLPSTIRNMVSIGLRQGQYDWVYQLLETHKNRIAGTAYPKEIYHFNLANYYFELKEYKNTLNYLSDNYEDLYYQIAARRLEIKVHFEEDTPLLESKMDAFKVFIYRLSKEKLPELPRKGNTSFFNALRQIINPATAVNAVRINRLILKIEKQRIIVEKEWLLEKLEELKLKA